MAQAAVPHLKAGDAIVNTGSIVGKVGIALLLDYSASKGAIHSFTLSLALSLGERGIRVNASLAGAGVDAEYPGHDAVRGDTKLWP